MEMFRALIEEYANGADVPRKALAGLTDADLDAFPVPGTWSIRQVITHLLDSDLVGIDRMKRVIAMDNPTLLAYDQDAFQARLGYQPADLPLVCEIFRLNRRLMADLLRRLPQEAFARQGHHNENGPMSLEKLVRVYVNHLNHHMDFLKQKRQALGKPLV